MIEDWWWDKQGAILSFYSGEYSGDLVRLISSELDLVKLCPLRKILSLVLIHQLDVHLGVYLPSTRPLFFFLPEFSSTRRKVRQFILQPSSFLRFERGEWIASEVFLKHLTITKEAVSSHAANQVLFQDWRIMEDLYSAC